MRACDAAQGLADRWMARVQRLLGHPVCACDGGHATPRRRQRVAQAGGGEIRADGLRLGRHRLEAVRLAPGAEVLEVGLVDTQGLRRVGGRLVGFGFGQCQGGAWLIGRSARGVKVLVCEMLFLIGNISA